jgi:hypothetical protein
MPSCAARLQMTGPERFCAFASLCGFLQQERRIFVSWNQLDGCGPRSS